MFDFRETKDGVVEVSTVRDFLKADDQRYAAYLIFEAMHRSIALSSTQGFHVGVTMRGLLSVMLAQSYLMPDQALGIGRHVLAQEHRCRKALLSFSLQCQTSCMLQTLGCRQQIQSCHPNHSQNTVHAACLRPLAAGEQVLAHLCDQ